MSDGSLYQVLSSDKSSEMCVFESLACVYVTWLRVFIHSYKLMHSVAPPHFKLAAHMYAWSNFDHQSD